MGSKIMLVVGILALVAGGAFFFMSLPGADRPRTGRGAGDGTDLAKLQARIDALEGEKADLAAHVARLQEQLAAAGAAPDRTAAAGTPGGGKPVPEDEGLTKAQKIHRKFKGRLGKYARLLAKLVKAEKEGRSPEEFMNDPDMLAMQADMLSLMAELQKEFGIPYMEAAGGMMLMSFLLEPMCEELGVTLTDAQKAKLESGNMRLIEGLLKLNEDQDMFGVEKAYERMALMREYGGVFDSFLTEEQKKELGEFGRFGELSGMSSMTWSPDMRYRPESADEQAGQWRDAFGIKDENAAGALNSIAQDYLASYRDLERRYDLDQSRYRMPPESLEDPFAAPEDPATSEPRTLTDEERKQMEREMLKIEVNALTKISGLGLTDEQKKKVRNYDPFNPMTHVTRSLRSSKDAANAASAISRLRTLSSAQELYNVRYEKYAATLDELKEKNFIDKEFDRTYEYTIELGSVTKDTWSATATPDDWSGRHFYIDETGVIYEEKGRPADANSKTLGG